MKNLSQEKLSRIVRERKMAVKALLSTKHTLLAHIIPMRRCNLACGYCNEFDKVSEPVPLIEMKRRIDKLASFGTRSTLSAQDDPKRGIGVVFLTQDLPFYNVTTMDVMKRFERLIYQHLQ